MEFLKLFERKVPAEEKTEKKDIIILVSVIAGAVLIVAGIAFFVYRLLSKRAEMKTSTESVVWRCGDWMTMRSEAPAPVTISTERSARTIFFILI